MTNYSNIRYASSGTTVYADMNALIAATGSDGDQALVQSNNNIYVYSGTGWYKIATVQNDSPSAITGVAGSYVLATDGTATTITAVSTDPEGFPLTWTYSTSGLGSIATVSQTDNVFTITPSTNDANAGTFTLTINATDGVNGAVSATTSIALDFIIVNSNRTTLLATAIDNSTNNNITDSSSNNHGLNGTNPYAGTFSPYRHGGYSVYTGAVDTDYVKLDASTNYNFDDSGWQLEGWVYPTSFDGGAAGIFEFYINDDTTFRLFQQDTGLSLLGKMAGTDYVNLGSNNGTQIPLNQWSHFAVTWDGTQFRTYLNGLKVGGSSTISTDITGYLGGSPLYLAQDFVSTDRYMKGYMYDFRLQTGSSAVTYTGETYTMPVDTLTTDSNTKFHLAALPYPSDKKGGTVTFYGNATIKGFTPFDNSEYSAAAHGGSVFFDGDSDHLEGPSVDIMGNGAFTVECWVYILSNTTGTTDAFLAQYQTNNKFIIGVKSDVVRVWMAGSEVRVGTTNINNNGWHHIALVRDSYNSCQLYVDGVADGAAFTNSTDFSTSLENFEIGSWNAGGTSDLHGYISDLRVVKGTAVYTSAFTPPIAPLSTISGTTLHVKGTDASIIDKSQTGNIKVFGTATGSSTEVKFANTKSMYFPGTNSHHMTHYNSFNLPDEFTIECWVNPSTFNSGYVWCLEPYQLEMRINSNGTGVDVYDNGYINFTRAAGAMSTGTWYHIAVCRDSSNVFRVWIDGVRCSESGTKTTTYTGDYTIIGGEYASATTTNWPYHGYVQDLRISNYARYPYTPAKETLTSGTLTKALACHAASETTAVYGASSTSLSVSKNGTPTASDFGPAAGMKSVYFDGNDDWLTIDLGSAIGTNDFCVEGWAYRDASSGTANSRGVFSISDDTNGWSSSGSNISLQYRNGSNGNEWGAFLANGQRNITDTDTVMSKWYHFVVQRNGGTSYVFIDGNMIYSIADTYDYSGKQYLAIGTYHSDDDWYGYISNLRVSVGSGSNFYANSFTPPTEPLKG